MPITALPPLLRELKGAPLALLIALRWAGQPVAQNWLQDATGYKRDTTREGLRLLKRLGLAAFDGDDYCTNCQLTGAAAQLPLGYDLLDAPTESTASQSDPVPPSAGVPLAPAADYVESSAIKSHSQVDALIVLKDSESTLSINNNKAHTAKKSQLARPTRERVRQVKHLFDILAERQIEPASGANPLPSAWRPAVDHLVALGVSQERAELAVALSPWVPDQVERLLPEIEAWTAHCQSPITGKNVDHRWPYIVATNLQTGKACPTAPVDQTDPNRFDGYLNPDA